MTALNGQLQLARIDGASNPQIVQALRARRSCFIWFSSRTSNSSDAGDAN